MPPKRKNHRWHTNNDSFDEFLRSRRLWRKAVAKDGSCLFRAVSEQVFHCQANHLEVRQACVNFMRRHPDQFQGFIEGPFDRYLAKISNPREWGGQVEMKALSLLYQRDFIVYREAGGEPDNVTRNGFEKKITLCFLGGNHYDSVYPIQFQKQASISQAVVYWLLYGRVFPQVGLGYNSAETDQNHLVDLESSGSSKAVVKGKGRRKTPLSFQDILTLVPDLHQHLKPDYYVNVELEVWKELRQSQQQSDRTVAVDMQYQIGNICEARLSPHSPFTTVEILDMKSTKGPLRIRVLDTGKELTVQMKYLRPSSQLQSWLPQDLQYHNMSGYYRKLPDEDGFQEVTSHRRKKQQSENGSRRQFKENKETPKQAQPKPSTSLESLPELEEQVTPGNKAAEATNATQLETMPGWQPPVVSVQEQIVPVMSYAKAVSGSVETKPAPLNEQMTDDTLNEVSEESKEDETTPQHLLSDSASNQEIQRETETNNSQNVVAASTSGEGKDPDESQAPTSPRTSQEFSKRPAFMHGPWLPFHPHSPPSNFNLKELVPSQDPEVKDLPADLQILQYVYNIGFMYLKSYHWHQMCSLNLHQQQLMAAQMASQMLKDNRADEQNATKASSPNEPETQETSCIVETRPPEPKKQSSPVMTAAEDPKLSDQELPTHSQRGDMSALGKDALPAPPNQLQDQGLSSQQDTNQMLDQYPAQDVNMQRIEVQTEMDGDSYPPELPTQTTVEQDMTEQGSHMTSQVSLPMPIPQFALSMTTPQLSPSAASFHMPQNQSAKSIPTNDQQRLMNNTGHYPYNQRGRRRRQFYPRVYHHQQPIYYDPSAFPVHSQMNDVEQHVVDEDAAYYMPGTGSVVRRHGRMTLMNASVPAEMYYVPKTGVQVATMDTQSQWFPDRR